MEKIKQLSIPSNARIIVTSDIHGEIDLLKSLLKKVNFNEHDHLIINGDLCEKGSNSKEVIRYVMELTKSNPQVHVTEGNCEALIEELMNENPKLINYLCARKHSVFNEWLAEQNYTVHEDASIQQVKEIIISNYAEEIKWLTALPTAIELDQYIVVHAGLEKLNNWQETERETALTIPSFLEKEHLSDKYVIVGHWPVVNYAVDLPCHNPIIDHKKKVISIDGGNVIKSDGQLNAFIIERLEGEDRFTHTYVDYLPIRKVREDFMADPEMVGTISYPNFEVTPMEKRQHFTLCKYENYNHIIYVKNEYLYKNDAGIDMVSGGISCSQLSVNKGDTVSVFDATCSGYTLVKKDGVVGWIASDILE
ncbi:metallophosphoesterase [Aquibacillus koreensis]|uniref:Metallophosphoesterase n=1 Tax=Aquibacillus koreensis TaxID=279446 RepID=A0A9X4AKP6_9BACI|nr:metallophosphoesterase [Aquibacillus koreensis]MCT2537266.1 metallophosphoesterase [Aquibacillus koreensis]MDC3421613.1 metallophosphoesterase [Aquibacillus koreensis]